MRRLVALGCLLFCAAAPGKDARETDVRSELDQELHALVKIPQPAVEVLYTGVDPRHFPLVRSALILDGQRLPGPPTGSGTLEQSVYQGELSPGDHLLRVELLYDQGAHPGGFAGSAGVNLDVQGTVGFRAARGLLLRIHTRVVEERDDDGNPRLEFRARIEPVMRAKLEDGQLPAPPAVSLVPASPGARPETAVAHPAEPKAPPTAGHPATPATKLTQVPPGAAPLLTGPRSAPSPTGTPAGAPADHSRPKVSQTHVPGAPATSGRTVRTRVLTIHQPGASPKVETPAERLRERLRHLAARPLAQRHRHRARRRRAGHRRAPAVDAASRHLLEKLRRAVADRSPHRRRRHPAKRSRHVDAATLRLRQLLRKAAAQGGAPGETSLREPDP